MKEEKVENHLISFIKIYYKEQGSKEGYYRQKNSGSLLEIELVEEVGKLLNPGYFESIANIYFQWIWMRNPGELMVALSFGPEKCEGWY